MRKANTVGSDKYFHCLANCQAAKRGQGGQDAARHFSETREWFDEHIKGDTTSACDQDRAANQQGRNADQNQSCKQACQSLRPSWLAPKW